MINNNDNVGSVYQVTFVIKKENEEHCYSFIKQNNGNFPEESKEFYSIDSTQIIQYKDENFTESINNYLICPKVSEATTAEAPTAQAPTAEASTVEASTAEASTAETVEASTAEASTAETVEASTVEASTAEAPTVEASTAEASTAEASTVEAPTEEAQKAEAPTAESPTEETPTSEAPTAEAPTVEAITEEASTVEAPTAEAPTVEAPTEEAPTAEAPTAEAPTAEAPTVEAPTVEAPTVEAPTVEAPTEEEAQKAEAPTVEASTAEAPILEDHNVDGINIEEEPTAQQQPQAQPQQENEINTKIQTIYENIKKTKEYENEFKYINKGSLSEFLFGINNNKPTQNDEDKENLKIKTISNEPDSTILYKKFFVFLISNYFDDNSINSYNDAFNKFTYLKPKLRTLLIQQIKKELDKDNEMRTPRTSRIFNNKRISTNLDKNVFDNVSVNKIKQNFEKRKGGKLLKNKTTKLRRRPMPPIKKSKKTPKKNTTI